MISSVKISTVQTSNRSGLTLEHQLPNSEVSLSHTYTRTCTLMHTVESGVNTVINQMRSDLKTVDDQQTLRGADQY